MRIFRRFRAGFAIIVLVAVAACTSWRPYEGTPRPTTLPSQVRVTLGEGEEFTLVRPRLLDDTLLVGRASRHGPESFSAPLSSIRLLEVRRFNPGKTALVVGVAVVVGGWAYRLFREFEEAAPGGGG